MLAIYGLNRFRNKLIAAGRYTDAVDEPLKVVYAKPRKHGMRGGKHKTERYITDERTEPKYELAGDYRMIAGEEEPE